MTFRCLLIIHTLLLSFKIWTTAIPLPPAIRMPAFANDTDILFYLNAIHKQWPSLFHGAVNFDVNLIGLMKDQQRLLADLTTKPKYVEAFVDRPYMTLTLKPQKDFEVISVRISPMAVMMWRRELVRAFERANFLPNSILEQRLRVLIEDGKNFVTAKSELKEQSERGKELLQEVWGSPYSERIKNIFTRRNFRTLKPEARKNRALLEIKKELEDVALNPDLKPRLLSCFHDGIEIDDITREILGLEFDPLFKEFFTKTIREHSHPLSRLRAFREIIIDLLHNGALRSTAQGFLDERLKRLENAIAHFEELLRAKKQFDIEFGENQEDLEAKLKLWGQLYVVLHRGYPHFETSPHDDVKRPPVIDQLTDDDLSYFADIDALKVHLSWAPWLHNFVNQSFQIYANQKRSYRTKVEPKHALILQELEPPVGVLRGFIAGDCASKFSFPYPNDSNERVFAILDAHDRTPKGILSATIVETAVGDEQPEKTLYVITIAGKGVTAGNVETIFRGLEQVKARFGVERIVLPSKINLASLLNYSEIAGVFQQHVSAGKHVSIQYRDSEIRKTIEDFRSDNNTGDYDKMDRNRRGNILILTKEDIADDILLTQVEEFEPQEIEPLPMKASEMILFALNQHAAKRFDIVDAIANSSIVNEHIGRETFSRVIATIDNGQRSRVNLNRGAEATPKDAVSTTQHLGVSEFRREAQAAVKELGLLVEDFDLDTILYGGHLCAPDAYEAHHIEKTAKLIASDIKRNILAPHCGWQNVLLHRRELVATPAFSSVLEKLRKRALGGDEQVALQATYYLLALYPPSHVLDKDERDALRKLLPYVDCTVLFDIKQRLLTHPSARDWEEQRALKTLFDQKFSELSVETLVGYFFDLPLMVMTLEQENQKAWHELIWNALEKRLSGYQPATISDEHRIESSSLERYWRRTVEMAEHYQEVLLPFFHQQLAVYGNQVHARADVISILRSGLVDKSICREILSRLAQNLNFDSLLDIFIKQLSIPSNDDEFMHIFIDVLKKKAIKSDSPMLRRSTVQEYLVAVTSANRGEARDFMREFLIREIEKDCQQDSPETYQLLKTDLLDEDTRSKFEANLTRNINTATLMLHYLQHASEIAQDKEWLQIIERALKQKLSEENNSIYSTDILHDLLKGLNALQDNELTTMIAHFVDEKLCQACIAYSAFKMEQDPYELISPTLIPEQRRQAIDLRLMEMAEAFVEESCLDIGSFRLLDSSRWVRFAKFLGTYLDEISMRPLVERFSMLGHHIVTHDRSTYNIRLLGQFLFENGDGDFWPEHREHLRKAMSDPETNFHICHLGGFLQFWEQRPESQERSRVFAVLHRLVEERLDDIMDITTFADVSRFYRYSLDDKASKQIKEGLRRRLLIILLTAEEFAAGYHVDVFTNNEALKAQWLEVIADLETMLSLMSREARMEYGELHYPEVFRTADDNAEHK